MRIALAYIAAQLKRRRPQIDGRSLGVQWYELRKPATGFASPDESSGEREALRL
jgi:hypothetical protein